MWMTRVAVQNPVFATMVMLALTVLGLFSYSKLRVEQMPDVSLPFINVAVAYPGASPEGVETDITKPMEQALNTLPGVKMIRSNSFEGLSNVFVEFKLETNPDKAGGDTDKNTLTQVATAYFDKIAVSRLSETKTIPVVNRSDVLIEIEVIAAK